MSALETRIGFVSHSDQQGPHHDRLLALVPPGVTVEVRPVGGGSRSQHGPASLDEQATQARAIAHERAWQAVACTGAPVQMDTPGYLERMREVLPVPVTTAVEASGSALRALRARNALLLTPFQRNMNEKIGAYTGHVGRGGDPGQP